MPDHDLSTLYGFPGKCGEPEHWIGEEIREIVQKLGTAALSEQALALLAKSAQERAKAEAY
ncbi:hypothetical protein [Aureimonas psammosilenae]|uniref:hypothetical protein n=1 Tax=Aureimonas psammosilenae TaxID=2495496 RepID=UPI0012606238|nr:hypothetical protein [Aureimonas psammosilenae]